VTTDLDQLVADCKAALREDRPPAALREVLQRVLARPSDVLDALPAPKQSSFVVHVDDELTIMQVVNEPGFVYLPHDHGLWSACAFYAGRERNTFYRRTPNGLQKASGKEYGEGDVVIMGKDVIHSTENPLEGNNAALHVFAGDEFAASHSQWDIETFEEQGFSSEYAMTVYPALQVGR
jgi:predicted metal-dependent enzyme (double-stranded beta helix superfamily)